MNKNEIYLKKSTEKLADFFAHTKTQLMGISPDDKNYNRWYKKYFKQFCEEAVLHSMTPSGELKANPIASAVKSEFTVDPVIDKHFRGSQAQAKVLKHQIDSAIQSLVSAFLQIRFGTQAKNSKEKESDLTYKSGDAEGMLEVEMNRYFTYMVGGLMYGYIEKFFDQPVGNFPDIFEEMLPKDTNGEISLRSLRNKAERKKFAKAFVQAGKQVK
jgi:hypothetical protein